MSSLLSLLRTTSTREDASSTCLRVSSPRAAVVTRAHDRTKVRRSRYIAARACVYVEPHDDKTRPSDFYFYLCPVCQLENDGGLEKYHERTTSREVSLASLCEPRENCVEHDEPRRSTVTPSGSSGEELMATAGRTDPHKGEASASIGEQRKHPHE